VGALKPDETRGKAREGGSEGRNERTRHHKRKNGATIRKAGEGATFWLDGWETGKSQRSMKELCHGTVPGATAAPGSLIRISFLYLHLCVCPGGKGVGDGC
jgi:hypothetical protein